ncbi:Kdo hydroxylase family protein [Rhizomicrobium electricum]|uniref:Kdo hydroxylase family protein n=1 Tax=Rhizomicrobium electricum TaxID=480070 RepID=A0ABN1EWF6_9PROT|nr:Kdo hydroxylase family protein [Rhizomicrobium electricum]
MVCVWAPDARSATAALEGGRIVMLPGGFALHPQELALRDPALLSGAKNISLSPDRRLKHAAGSAAVRMRLKTMMARFAAFARDTVEAIAPHYRGALVKGRTSFRPAEIEGRAVSPLKDDTRLHVDAFPANPTRGKRILRVFANVHSHAPRHWTTGEPFADMAARFLPDLTPNPPILNALYAAVGATTGRRSPYDDLMLGLHDTLKRDPDYQAQCPKRPQTFAAGTVWICYTDVVLHAALKGQHALEQTFLLPVEAMAEPDRSPLRILERMTGRRLV